MYTSHELMDMVKARYSLASDYSLAKKIGCSKSFIYEVRKGNTHLGFEFSLICGQLLGLDPLQVIASSGIETAQKKHNQDSENLWRQYA